MSNQNQHPTSVPSVNKPETAINDSTTSADDEFDAELLAAFKIESEEQLEVADYQMLLLESDPGNAKALNALFRAFHTIKGNAGFLKIDPTLGNLAHDAETVLSLCRSSEMSLIGQAFDLILESAALMRVLVLALGDADFSAPSVEVVEQANYLRQSLKKISEAHLAQANDQAKSNEPPAAALDTKEAAPTVVNDGGDFFQEPTPASLPEAVETAQPIALASPVPQQQPSPKPAPKEKPGPLGNNEQEPRQESSQSNNETLRVDRGRLDLLVELIGELVIAESMAQQDATNTSNDPALVPAKLRNMAQLNRITRTLQELSLSLRMVPLRSTFQKMTRIARDLTRKLDKNVDFVVEGENTELDKTVVDEIGDPLMHMVRNAIDHGIEGTVEERVANGKSPRGKVVLRAFHQSGNIHIEIQDDGRGLNAERILAKAKSQKIVPEDAVLSESEILGLIFEPGFSTADKVTDVSGRGVGMDVVRRNIQALRGSVDIKTKLGEGSCFTIRMPLTLAIINGLVVRVGSGRYVIPTLCVTELMQLDGASISTIADRYSILTVRDQNVPLVRLDKMLGLPCTQTPSQKGIIVVVQDGPHTAAITVDEVLGQQQVVIKQLGHNMAECHGVAGGAIMPDGQIGIIVDIHAIIEQSRGKK